MKFRILFIALAITALTACTTTSAAPTPTYTPLEQIGQSVYALRCAQCHALVPDTVVIGPSLAGVATRAESRVPGMGAEEYIETSILFPKAPRPRIYRHHAHQLRQRINERGTSRHRRIFDDVEIK